MRAAVQYTGRRCLRETAGTARKAPEHFEKKLRKGLDENEANEVRYSSPLEVGRPNERESSVGTAERTAEIWDLDN
jgi:hypothetical protein